MAAKKGTLENRLRALRTTLVRAEKEAVALAAELGGKVKATVKKAAKVKAAKAKAKAKR